MESINFKKNWNYKVGCNAYSTIRLYNPEKYTLGETYHVWCSEDRSVDHFAKIVQLKELSVGELTEQIAYLDTGLSLEETKELLRSFYPDITEETKLHFIILKNEASELYTKAYKIAQEAHAGQTDKARRPYLEHPTAVAKMCVGEDQRLVALLHDVVEDSDWTFEMLEEEGFPERIVEAVRCLTRNDGEPYDEFIHRTTDTYLSTYVKMYDLRHNMDLTRLWELDDKTIERLKKYLKAYNYLWGVIHYSK